MASPSDRSNRFSDESADFLSFSNPQQQQQQNQHQNRPRWPQQQSRGRPYFRGHNSHRHNFNQSTPYGRETRPFRNNFNRSAPNWNNRNEFNNQKKKEFDASMYFHPSMLENPWAELEDLIKSKMEDSSTSDDSNSDNESTHSNSDTSIKKFSKTSNHNNTR